MDLCADVDCAIGEICMPGTGMCSEGNCMACDDESDCSDGDVCVRYNGNFPRFCAPNCDDGPCPPGYFCREGFLRDGQRIDACVPNDPDGPATSLSVCEELESDRNAALCADINCDEGFRCEMGDCLEIVPGSDREISDWGNGFNNAPVCNEDDQCIGGENGETCVNLRNIREDICLMPCGDELACPDGFICCGINDDRADSVCITPNSVLNQFCE